MSHFPCPVSIEPNFLPVGSSFGHNAVVRPTSTNALSACIIAASKLGKQVVPEFGAPAYNPATISQRLAGAVVAKLDAFNSLHVSPDGTVVIGAAVTIAALVSAARHARILLPVPDLPHETVVDALKSGVQSHFSRTIGTLHSRLTAATIVQPDGAIVHAAPETDAALIDDALSHSSTAIVTSLFFRAIPTAEAAEYWLARTAVMYHSETALRLLTDLFATVAKTITDQSDILVHTKAAMYNIPVIVVYVSGKGEHSSDAFLHAVKDAVLRVTGNSPQSTGVFKVFKGAAAGPETIASGEMGRLQYGKEAVLLHHTFPMAQVESAIQDISVVVDETLGTNAEGELFSVAVSSSTRISINKEGELELSAFLFKPTFPSQTDKEVASRFQETISMCRFPETPDFSTLQANFAPPVVPPTIKVKENLIPNFKGNVYMQGDVLYEDRAYQYATTSYPAQDMTPYMVAFPFDEEDIAAAIAFAKSFPQQKNVVGRSGGHQYSGLSSGGNETIVLSMDYFRDVIADPNNFHIITAGVGVRLTHIADEFDKAGVTVPHGECPLVAIGGHTQSGGYGHLLRSYGLIIDHVRSFRIVVGDGSAHEILKPGVVGTRSLPNNDDVYFAVLGGGPSSFGILTTITYDTIKNVDHPYSGGLMATLTYKKKSFRAIMEELQARTVKICDGDTLQADSDMMASALSFDLRGFAEGSMSTDQPEPEGDAIMEFPIMGLPPDLPFLPDGILLLELVYGDHDASEDTMNSTIDSFNKLYEKVKVKTIIPQISFTSFNGKKLLSSMSNDFVRRFGTGKEGREFQYPYEKRLNGSFVPLTDGFVTGFVNLCSDVIKDEKVRLVFQVGLGGSQHLNGGMQKAADGSKVSITGCSRRKCSILIVFDVFYTAGNQEVAKQYQVAMGELLDREFPEGQAVRLLWGCYGDTDIKNVWDYYYDNPQLYSKLQGIKEDVDPKDVFHTRFNVQLPSQHNISS
ncbi:unnamed protein product [Chondrus crispus]|uniref:FAD-binding PCMH-type domain-containing protein n=1 Tax=Chondrus crispus TaxID=2769 RepID=R7QS14_CHOCR|nr:unnamed protein product [Chondrus crispus]CDF40175.1 unnamed protein product [Chondrus crispus]|eukprot:XP_005710469.1 unnamed protein product [Chondrus crispus]